MQLSAVGADLLAKGLGLALAGADSRRILLWADRVWPVVTAVTAFTIAHSSGNGV